MKTLLLPTFSMALSFLGSDVREGWTLLSRLTEVQGLSKRKRKMHTSIVILKTSFFILVSLWSFLRVFCLGNEIRLYLGVHIYNTAQARKGGKKVRSCLSCARRQAKHERVERERQTQSTKMESSKTNFMFSYTRNSQS